MQPELTSTLGEKPPGERHKGLQSRPAWREAHSWPGASGRGLQAREQGTALRDPQVTTRRLPKPLQLRHGLDSEFSTPGPHGPWTPRPPKSAPRSPPTCRAEVGGQAHEGCRHPGLLRTRLSTAQAAGLVLHAGEASPGAQTLPLS